MGITGSGTVVAMPVTDIFFSLTKNFFFLFDADINVSVSISIHHHDANCQN